MRSNFIVAQVLLGFSCRFQKMYLVAAMIFFYSICLGQIQLIGESEITVNCEDSYNTTFFPEVINNCGTYDLAYEDTNINGGDCLPGLLRTFSAVNTCNDSTFFVQIIHVIDENAPSITYLPFDAVYECPYSNDFGLFDFPAFSDCTNINQEYSWTVFNLDPCLTSRVIYYTATDECGNITSVQWTETFTDTTPPVFDVVPPTCMNCTVGVVDEYPQFHDNCETESVVIGYTWNEVDINSTALNWTLTDQCGNVSTATTIYAHPCVQHSVELTILSQYPDSNLDIEFDIFNNVTTNVASGTFVIDDDYMTEEFCLPDGCYEIYMGPQGNLQEGLWQLKVDNVIILQSESFNSYVTFSVGISTCNAEGCNNQQACNFSPFDMGSSECCYECVELNLTPGMGNPYYPWEIWTTDPIQQLEISGSLPYASVDCFDILPFTLYELRMSSIDVTGWNGAVFTISNPEWNWSFSESLDLGVYESVFFMTGGPGCMNQAACNYNPLATIENGSCVIGEGVVFGLQLTDSNSNSWGNYSYELVDSNNQVIHNGTHTGGAQSNFQFCLPTDCYIFRVLGFGPGSAQIGWNLLDQDGTIMFTGGAPANITFGYGIGGNLNNDCAVNIGDLLVFISQFPCSSNCGGSDFNNDGYTNVADLLFFTTTFGTSY